ncbi:MAG: zf-HC2 domain-containing protein [Chloroflexi bacterium]|nr:zf-HC2 domain-containing protein [Chloroflexota bacterium]
MEHSNCRHLLGSLSEYVDGALEEQLCAEIERHLSGCENCRVVVDTLNKTVSLYHQSAARAIAPSGVRQRLFKRLDLEEFLGKNEDSL